MKRALNVWVVGGDLRQAALARQLAEDGHTVHTYALEEAEGMTCEDGLAEITRADCVVLPLPAVDDRGMVNAPLSALELPAARVLDAMRAGQLVCAGMVRSGLREAAEKRGLLLCDYFAREELAVANAVPTAEGAVQIAMEELPITLHTARVLVIGYGRLGKVTAQRMAAMGARVTVAARSYEQLEWARVWGYATEHTAGLIPYLCGYDLVVNTVPELMLARRELSALKRGVLVIDLASKPGGVDMEAAKELGVRTVWALSLPGRVAPESSGSYIRSTIYHIIGELEP